MKTQLTSNPIIDPSVLTPSSVLDAVTLLVANYPCGIACYSSANALHQIIEEIPATLRLAHGELIAIAPAESGKVGVILGLEMVAWHFTDEDGRVHVTLAGVPELRMNNTSSVIAELATTHQEMVLANPDHLMGPNVIATKLRSIRLEVPSLDLNVLIQVEVENKLAPSVALAS